MALLLQVRQWEGAFTHYHIFCGLSFVVPDLLSWWKNYDSNAWVLFQVEVSTFSSISRWLHDQQAARYIHQENATLLNSIKQEKDRGLLNIGYNTQEVLEIQAGFEGVHCVFSGLWDKPHWQEFPVKWNKVQHLVKNQTM
jgi:hypothetical protein